MFNLLDIHSLTEFQRNSRRFLARLQESHKPVVLTINGKAAIVMQDAESYQALLDELQAARETLSNNKVENDGQLFLAAES